MHRPIMTHFAPSARALKMSDPYSAFFISKPSKPVLPLCSWHSLHGCPSRRSRPYLHRGSRQPNSSFESKRDRMAHRFRRRRRSPARRLSSLPLHRLAFPHGL